MKSLFNSVLVLLALHWSVSTHAQPTPAPTSAFDVASVRPNPSGANSIRTTPVQLSITSSTLVACIKWAYNVQDGQIERASSVPTELWSAERFDIVAKTNEPVSEGRLRVMLQTLLSERFHLVLHTEMKDKRVFSLVVEKSGSKLHPSEGDGESKQQLLSKINRQWKWTTMSQFADNLSEAMQSPVLDQTGLSGKFDFGLNLTTYMPPPGEQPDIAGMLITAIREQLGLRMEPRRTSLKVIVVDRVENPSTN